MSQQHRSTFVLRNPSEIVQALVGLKDVRVLAYERRGRDVDLLIEQVVRDVHHKRPPAASPSLTVSSVSRRAEEGGSSRS